MRKLGRILLAFLLVIMLVPSVSMASKKTIIKIGHGANEKYHMHRALLEFKRLVEEGSNGSMEIQIFPSESSKKFPSPAKLIDLQPLPAARISPTSLGCQRNPPLNP